MTASDDDVANEVLTILVADDDALMQELICSRLRAHGYLVIEAPNGDDALPILQANSIDALVSDISMPGTLDGWSLVEQARLMDPDIAVVYASNRPPETARQVSGSLYLQKPFHPDKIIASIRHLLSRRTGGEDQDDSDCQPGA